MSRFRGAVPILSSLRPIPAWFLVAATVATALLIWSLQPTATLEIRAGEEGQLVKAVPVEAGERITYTFVHSVHRTPVTETLEVGADGHLRLREVEFDTTGAGVLPEELGGTFLVDEQEGKFRVVDLSLDVSPWRMRVAVAQQQSLVIRGETISINSLAPPQTRLAISVASRPRLAVLAWLGS